jgi:uncharacterized protein (TIGR03083 family)
MDGNKLIDVIEAEASRLAHTVRARPEAVPSHYPEWTAVDVAAHTGRLFHRTADVVSRLAQEAPEPVAPPSEEPAEVVAWFEDAARTMTAELRAADPEAEVWGVRPGYTVGRWTVRMTMEAVVHRWDVESGGATPSPIDPAVAALGIDEFATVWAPRMTYDGDDLAGMVVDMMGGEAEHAWTVHLAGGGCSMMRGGGSAADATITGSTGSLFLWLNGRVPTAELAVTGDVAAVEGLATAARGLPRAAR